MSEHAPKPWIHPSNYAGTRWEGWLVFLGQNRDSDCLTRCNFEVALKALEAIPSENPDSVQRVRESHWACGWIEWIAIHPSNANARVAAEDMAAKLDQYSVLDEDRWSEMEHEEACENWDPSSVREELKRAGVSERTISNLPSMDREDAAFIRETWASDGADYETRDDGGCYFRFSDVGRDRAAWAIKWLRETAK